MKKMISIAICDDDIFAAKEIERLIKKIDKGQNYDISIFDNGNDFLSSNYSSYDMVFLDIEIGDTSGINIAVELRKINENVIIFFITSYSSYISEALKSMPFQYILKPINEKKELFIEEFKRGIANLKKLKHILMFNTLEGEEFIRADSIRYVEYLNKNIVIHTDSRIIDFVGKFNDWIDKLLPYDFVQCHKSFIVNLSHIDKIKCNEIIMDDNKLIPIGRKYLQEVRRARNRFMAGINL